jgi:uncharacterized protein
MEPTMEPKIKNLLGVSITIVLFVLAIASLLYVNAYSKAIEPASYRSFSVTGEGKAVGKPDIAYFTFDVISQGRGELGALQQTNTERTNKAIEFLKSNGVDSKDIATENYLVSPQYQTVSCSASGTGEPVVCPPPQIVSYTVTQTVSVKVRNFSDTGRLVQGTVQNGANQVSQLDFRIDDPAGLQNDARAKAIEKAKEKARQIAAAGSFRLGRLLSIQEGNYSYPQPYLNKGVAYGTDAVAPAAAPVPVLEPGTQDITVNVTLTYEID